MTSEDEIASAVAELVQTFPDEVFAADPAGLRELAELVPTLPPDVRMLYELIGGMKPQAPVYLMSPVEVANTVRDFRRLPEIDDPYARRNAELGDGTAVLLLFYDEQSNYLGVHLSTSLASKGFVLDHDEPDLAPRFRGVASMVRHVTNHLRRGIDCTDISADFPLSGDSI